MSEPGTEYKAATRRGFLLGAGAATGGMAVLGAGLQAATPPTKTPPAAGGQQPAAGGQPPAPGGQNGSGFRASAPPQKHLSQLGPLRELAGTWVGRGFNQISLPDFDNPQGPQPFRLKLNSTRGDPRVPADRRQRTKPGIHGARRHQHLRVDLPAKGQRQHDERGLHIEPGIWLHVPATKVPEQPATVVRQGSIPHGTSILAAGCRHSDGPRRPQD